ncbi:MAG: hypothetical protein ACREAA_17810 [Candidatus Polarisedimenticolia bacterium]
MRELMIDQSIFIGFKVDRQLRERLASLDDSDKKYVSSDSSMFLRICGVGEDLYIGKLVDDRLTTDRVEDIRRNVLSLIRKVGHDAHLPTSLQILVCSPNNDRLPALGTNGGSR